ncbi:hypothetical protein [Shewanella woodyi]|uniref:Uncharacterized protein n=1 Tax=Shewanella woodyi (strain ATCC 51908 / MS32) TaxID=392500 RepID=B1KI15_SHEWM|nr:hypothetical protein [Shewanella woodyi]ACA85493.1 hypothetical protein Swoo_1200 [Shewanella woodyi ATCC 51908]
MFNPLKFLRWYKRYEVKILITILLVGLVYTIADSFLFKGKGKNEYFVEYFEKENLNFIHSSRSGNGFFLVFKHLNEREEVNSRELKAKFGQFIIHRVCHSPLLLKHMEQGGYVSVDVSAETTSYKVPRFNLNIRLDRCNDKITEEL